MQEQGADARKRLEDKFVAALNEKVLNAELLEQAYERTAIKVKELFVFIALVEAPGIEPYRRRS